jgi:hypothetical protein
VSGTRTVRMRGCARCHGEHEDEIEFLPLDHPVVEDGKTVATHWALCPTNGQPILMITLATKRSEDGDRA